MTLYLARRWSPASMPTAIQMDQILDGCQDHRPWYQDGIWNAGPEVRRWEALRYLIQSYEFGLVWDLLRDDRECGIFLLNTVRLGNDAQCHMIFFDHQLANKRSLARELMADAFRELDLHALRVELPEYAFKLKGFLRKALGFRYEAERSLKNVKLAEQASRKHEAVLYEGRWQDVLLFSVTKDEFFRERTKHNQSGREHGPNANADTRDQSVSSGLAHQPPASPRQSPPAEPAPARDQ